MTYQIIEFREEGVIPCMIASLDDGNPSVKSVELWQIAKGRYQVCTILKGVEVLKTDNLTREGGLDVLTRTCAVLNANLTH